MRGAILNNRRGQATLLVAVMLSTFLFFFAFVINTGVLVNAKINLQNAADLAAYAGAATQARQLTQMSHLNYEMRRRYKKFLFRYNVLGTISMPDRPDLNSPNQNGPRPWSIRDTATRAPVNVGVPTVCVAFQPDRDNYCQLNCTPRIPVPVPDPNDPINRTLALALRELEFIRSRNCGSIGVANYTLLFLWLFNSDPSLSTLQIPAAGELARVMDGMRTLGVGLGLVPAEILLNLRAKNLWNNYLALPAATNVTLATAQAAQSSPEQERVAQAFFSAYHTLSDQIFNQNVTLTEFVPALSQWEAGGMNEIRIGFDTYASYFTQETRAGNPGGATGGSSGGVRSCAAASNAQGESSPCRQELLRVTVNQVPVGFWKSTNQEISYAVKLQAKARILFSPFGSLDLVAYSAAKPFGSRLGLSGGGATSTDFTTTFTRSGVPGIPSVQGNNVLQSPAVGRVPNLGVLASETGERGQGFDGYAMQRALTRELFFDVNTNAVASGNISFDRLWRALHVAMLPNPVELGRYNIPEDLGIQTTGNSAVADPFWRHFDSEGLMAVWAPLASDFGGGSTTQVQSVLRSELETIFDQRGPGLPTPGAGASSPNALIAALIQELDNYVVKLRGGQGEYGDGFNVARLPDPFELVDSTLALGRSPATREARPLQTNQLPVELFSLDSRLLRTSWNGVDAEPRGESARTGALAGRSSYSVKFVPLKSLQGVIPELNGLEIQH